VQAAFLHGGNKAIFYFTAEGRVDFRALVRDLAQQLHVRIEMRQIGVRDEAKLLGGIGICGQPLCCARYLRKFVPVSIKMAKNQGLALNPQKVSGRCGRLMCCLVYEDDTYRELRHGFPKQGKTIDTPAGPGKVIETDVLGGRVRVLTQGGISSFTLAQLERGRQELNEEGKAAARGEDRGQKSRRRDSRSGKDRGKGRARRSGEGGDRDRTGERAGTEDDRRAAAGEQAGSGSGRSRSSRRRRRRKARKPTDAGAAPAAGGEKKAGGAAPAAGGEKKEPAGAAGGERKAESDSSSKRKKRRRRSRRKRKRNKNGSGGSGGSAGGGSSGAGS